MSVLETIEAYYRARARHEAADKTAKALYAVRQDREREMIDEMVETETKGIKRDDGTYCGWKRKNRISVTQANDEQVRTWVLDETGDDSDFVVTACHKPAVEELVNGMLDEGTEPGDLPAFLKLNQQPIANVQGWKQLNKEPYLND